MSRTSSSPSGARHFMFRAYGTMINYYLTCDLDEGVLRYWPENTDEHLPSLLYSHNRDERFAARKIKERTEERASVIGVQLTPAQISKMEALLTDQCIDSMRGVDDEAMHSRTGGFCYRDDWCLDFYAEGDDGRPPLELRGITYCSFDGDELPFEELESYINSSVLGRNQRAFTFDVSYRVPPGKTQEIIKHALEVGLSALNEILWYGSERLLRQLDDTPIGKHFSYSLSSDSFVIEYGSMISRSCKVYDHPACVSVFGSTYVFEE